MGSGVSAGTPPRPADGSSADIRTRRTEIKARWEGNHTPAILRPSMGEHRNFCENIKFCRVSSIAAYHRPRGPRKSTTRRPIREADVIKDHGGHPAVTRPKSGAHSLRTTWEDKIAEPTHRGSATHALLKFAGRSATAAQLAASLTRASARDASRLVSRETRRSSARCPCKSRSRHP